MSETTLNDALAQLEQTAADFQNLSQVYSQQVDDIEAAKTSLATEAQAAIDAAQAALVPLTEKADAAEAAATSAANSATSATTAAEAANTAADSANTAATAANEAATLSQTATQAATDAATNATQAITSATTAATAATDAATAATNAAGTANTAASSASTAATSANDAAAAAGTATTATNDAITSANEATSAATAATTAAADATTAATDAATAANSAAGDASTAIDDFNAAIAAIRADFPVSPNLLADTYEFSQMCGGQVNTPLEIIAGHTDLWQAFYFGGTVGNGTVEVVTLDQLANKGLDFGGDLELATNATFSGSEFKVLLLNVAITGNQSDGSDGLLFVYNQSGGRPTGNHKGQTTTQAQALVNVLAHSGDIQFRVTSNMSAQIIVGSAESGQGWQFKHETRIGFGGGFQPYFQGQGSMTVAVALPYVGTGNHGGAFFWADSIQAPSLATNDSNAGAGMNNFRFTHRMKA